MRKTAFVISGFKMNVSAASDEYAALRSMIAGYGYDVVPVDILWNRRTVTKYASDFVEFYLQHKSAHNMIIGNSLGAMVALVTAGQLAPEKLILCSLSGFFQEDLPRHDDSDAMISRFGTRRWQDFGGLSAAEAVRRIDTSRTTAIMTYGELEKDWYPILVRRVAETARRLGTQPIELAGAPHSIRDPQYIAGLDKALQSIR